MDIKAYLPEALWNELLERLKLTESYLIGNALAWGQGSGILGRGLRVGGRGLE
jgi:hypothetical protein